MDKKSFWYEALKAGTIIGLVLVGFGLLTQPLDAETQKVWITILNVAGWTLTIVLLYGFTRKVAATSITLAPNQGFSFSRGVGFIVASMLFAGVIMGVYSTIMSNFFIKEQVLATVDDLMVLYQDMLPDQTFDQAYAMARRSVLNPFYITVSSVITNCFVGLLIALPVASLTRREANLFSQNNDSQTTSKNE
ncbi:MAG: DUF4199 domain-containing protein [Tidjanibacter sp.]|nr:DUF4199 domain-containing protein [Tidjanibacter sp.]